MSSSLLSVDEPLDSFSSEVVVNCPGILAWAAMTEQDKLYAAATRSSVKSLDSKITGNPLAPDAQFAFAGKRSDKSVQNETIILKKVVVGEKLVYRRKKQITRRILGIFPKTEISGTRIDEIEIVPQSEHTCTLKVTERFSRLSTRLRQAAEQGIRSKAALYQKFIENADKYELWDYLRKHLKALNLPIPGTPAGVLADRSLSTSASMASSGSNAQMEKPKTAAAALVAADRLLNSSSSSLPSATEAISSAPDTP